MVLFPAGSLVLFEIFLSLDLIGFLGVLVIYFCSNKLRVHCFYWATDTITMDKDSGSS